MQAHTLYSYKGSGGAIIELLWLEMERAVQGGPWFLGARQSLIDYYISVMVFWRPRREWFSRHCPQLHAIAEKMHMDPVVREILSKNNYFDQ